MRQLNVPSGMHRVSVVFCCALASVELGTANWTGGTSVFLRTCCPSWQETAWQSLMCFPARFKGWNEKLTPPESQGGFLLQLQNINTSFLFSIRFFARVLFYLGTWRAKIEVHQGKRRKEDWPVVLPAVIWQVMRGGTLLIYPHREKMSCWYRWHQDLFFLSSSFFLYSSITLGTLNLLWQQ